MGLGSAPSLLRGFEKVASGHRDEQGMTDRTLKEQSQGTRAAYLRGNIPLAAGPGGPSASSVPPPDSLIPRITPSSQVPAPQCTAAQPDFGGKDSKDTRSTLRSG